MNWQPHVFVVMPFGIKEAIPAAFTDDGRLASKPIDVDFTEIYDKLIAPALTSAGCNPFRADQEKGAGDIRTDMFFELVTADIVVADISVLNPNVFYELGVRHGIGPHGVFMIHGGWSKRPFDIITDRTFGYTGKLFETPAGQRDNAWTAQLTAEINKLANTLRDALAVDDQTIGNPVYKELVGLKPVDWSNIKTARAEYFGRVFVDWKARVEVAKANGLAGDILTLADDAPTRFHKGKLLMEAARALIGLHRFKAAKPVLEDLIKHEPQNTTALTQLGLVLGRLKLINEAKVHMNQVVHDYEGQPEAQGILGRVYKDLWCLEWDTPNSSLETRQQAALGSAALVAEAIRSYDKALRQNLASYYNGINVISLVQLLKHLAETTGEDADDAKIEDFTDLVAVVRLAAKAALSKAEASMKHEDAIWAAATLGEMELAYGDPATARKYYQRAANKPDITYFQINSMLDQIRLFERLGFRPEAVEAVRQVLTQKQERLGKPHAKYNKLLIASGHMIDSPDRKAPRFPASKEIAVRDCIASKLDEWGVGAGALAICGAARGADLLFAELCEQRGAEVWLYLALEEPEHLKESVRLPVGDWVERYYALLKKPSVKKFVQPQRLKDAPKDLSVYARNNLWMINTARAEAPDADQIYAILVWDEKATGDGPGGTSDFADKVQKLGGHLAIINPTTL